ncbi:MAG: hypothetical protein WAW80_02475 [Candidatus Saccharimonadales bacterium]
MLGFNHVLAGSIIAVITPAPLVPVVALASHFILDLSPHSGDSETRYAYSKLFKVQLVIDALLCIASLGLAMWLFPDKWFIAGVGAFFGILPDFLWVMWHKGPKWLDKFLDWANWIQWGERPYGWMFDAFYGMLMILALLKLSGNL